MFDRSLLPEALFEFVVVADTHYMLDPGDRQVEFRSRRLQTQRADVALRMIAAVGADFVVHLGDLVQEFPGRPAFSQAMDEASAQLERCGVSPRHVAGNHDVGDKPDPTMPTEPVTPESLAAYHERFGPSWYSFDAQGCHFVVLNSQIMNTGLREAEAQREWLNGYLAAHRTQRIFLFLHLPPYLWDEHELALGHYDNIAQPDRGWLLDLARRYEIELLMAGHVHCAFFDRVAGTRYLVANSTSFTRPGFCQMFSSSPPADHGRDDADKLGFYLVRVRNDRSDVHFVRTSGIVDWPQDADATSKLITRTPSSLALSPLGMTFCHPLTVAVEIPLAWPSAIRQKVRNDYPLLNCLELGATAVRVPATDLADRLQSRRLEILRDEGVRIIATSIWSSDLNVLQLHQQHESQVDGWELQLPGAVRLSGSQLSILQECRQRAQPIQLSAIVPGELIAGKQHRRTRHGFRLAELAALDRQQADADIVLDRVLCRIGNEGSPWDEVRAIAHREPHRQIGAIDCSLEIMTNDDRCEANMTADALYAMTMLPGSRLFIGPVIDFDRTMDVKHGVLDRQCNPRPAFHVLRCLNTVMAHARECWSENDELSASHVDADRWHIRVLQSSAWKTCLLLPRDTGGESNPSLPTAMKEIFSETDRLQMYDLAGGTVTRTTVGEALSGTRRPTFSSGPILLVRWT